MIHQSINTIFLEMDSYQELRWISVQRHVVFMANPPLSIPLFLPLSLCGSDLRESGTDDWLLFGIAFETATHVNAPTKLGTNRFRGMKGGAVPSANIFTE